MMGFGFMGMFLFWGLILAFLVGGGALLFRQVIGANPGGDQRQHRTARQLLDERFARGEIGGDEYDVMRAQIER